jgi:hypothetical protein
MSRINFVRLFSVLALAFGTNGSSALSGSTITYEVGTCMPGLPSFATITTALAATPAANVVKVCPGTYREQLQITQPLTLEGVSNDDSARAIIAPPAGGLGVNAAAGLNGAPVAAQLLVNRTSGPVNISDLTIDGTGNGNPDAFFIAGIFYEDVSGTVNRVVTRNQSGSLNGVGMWAEGASSPSVTIENSSVHDFDQVGIWVETADPTPHLTAVIKGNEIINSNPNGLVGLFIEASAVTVTNNLIVNQRRFVLPVAPIPIQGISVSGSTGSISANTVVNGAEGIDAYADGISVTSNKMVGSTTGIVLGTSIAAIQSNSITDSKVGIDFSCSANPNVHSNIITDVGIALNRVPAAVGTGNTYFNAGKIRTGGC